MPAEAIGPEDKSAEVVGVGVCAGLLLDLECTRRIAVITGVTCRSESEVARRPEDRDKMYHDASYT